MKRVKLNLRSTTLRHLSAQDLDAAIGGLKTQTCPTQLDCNTQAANGCLTGQKTVC